MLKNTLQYFRFRSLRSRLFLALSLSGLAILFSGFTVEAEDPFLDAVTCTGYWGNTGWVTTSNTTCTGQPGAKFGAAAQDYFHWTESTGHQYTTYLAPSYGDFSCQYHTPEVARTTGLFLDEFYNKEADFATSTLQYRTTQQSGLFVVRSETSTCGWRDRPSPIVINFDHADLKFTSAENGVDFDLLRKGTPQRLGWTELNSEGAFLVRGPIVIDGGQLFGNLNEQAAPLFANEKKNGYRALRVFDLNQDQKIDFADPIYSELYLWFDRNHNGIGESGELEPLASRVTSISLDYLTVGKKDQHGNELRFKSDVVLLGGSKRFSFDLFPARQLITSQTVTVLN